MSRMDLDPRRRVEVPSTSRSDEGFRLGYIGLAKEELSVEIGKVNSVKVDLEMLVSQKPKKNILFLRSMCGHDGYLTSSMLAKPTKTRFFTAITVASATA